MLKELKTKVLDKLWSAMYSELYEDKQETVGKILTIIDAVIVDKDQNKSVKDLIKKSIWEEFERRTTRMVDWFIWFNSRLDFNEVKTPCLPEPFRYDGEDRNPSLENYIK